MYDFDNAPVIEQCLTCYGDVEVSLNDTIVKCPHCNTIHIDFTEDFLDSFPDEPPITYHKSTWENINEP